jgi:hypothetical protein
MRDIRNAYKVSVAKLEESRPHLEDLRLHEVVLRRRVVLNSITRKLLLLLLLLLHSNGKVVSRSSCFIPRHRSSGPYWRRGWVGPTIDVDTVVVKKRITVALPGSEHPPPTAALLT